MKIIKNNIFGFILGAIIFGCLGVVAATAINARDIAYKDSNVEEALDDLYDKANNSNDYTSGILILNSTTSNSINLNFKPKYIMITVELANGSASNNEIFYYNSLVNSSKSYRYDRGSATLQEFNLGSNSTRMHISNVSDNGFEFYAPDIDGRKLYWTAFK